MKITTTLGYAGGFQESAAQVKDFERAGLDLVWVAEAYGLDGPSLMGYLAALTETVEYPLTSASARFSRMSSR